MAYKYAQVGRSNGMRIPKTASRESPVTDGELEVVAHINRPPMSQIIQNNELTLSEIAQQTFVEA